MLQFRNGGNTSIAGTSSSNSVRSSKAIRPADDVPGRQVGVTLADVTLMPSGDRVRSSCDMTDIVKVFGCRPHDDGAAHSGGQRPQTFTRAVIRQLIGLWPRTWRSRLALNCAGLSAVLNSLLQPRQDNCRPLR